MTVTLKDIAERVGKSITTVSRALNDFDDVSPATKNLVRQVASELQYSPNTFAQRLQKRRSDTISLVLTTFGPRFSDPFFSEFLAGVGNKAAELDYDILVSTCSPGDEETKTYQHIVKGHRADGFIIIRTRQQDTRVEYLHSIGFPFVSFGRVGNPLHFPLVDEDSEHGMRLVVDHLAGLGHRRIACIVPPLELMFAHHRLKGFREGLNAHGIPIKEEYFRVGNLTHSSGFEHASALMSLAEPPTAIAACNDLMALGAISAVQKRGLKVGEDVAITGFDNIPLAEHSHPPLTTVHQPIYQIGSMVCEMLIQRIQNRTNEKEQTILEPTLIIRQSSGVQ